MNYVNLFLHCIEDLEEEKVEEKPKSKRKTKRKERKKEVKKKYPQMPRMTYSLPELFRNAGLSEIGDDIEKSIINFLKKY